MDKVTTTLLDVLKQAMAAQDEQRLFRSGKLPGLFLNRRGTNVDAAKQALRDGLLEVVRIEPRGNTEMQWVRPTPKAVDFVHNHESPTATMRDLQSVLQTTKMCIPVWLEDMHQRLAQLENDIRTEMHAISHRLDSVCCRVEESLARAQAAEPQVSDYLSDTIPWAADMLVYLQRRNENGSNLPCPLSELYTALRQAYPDITISEYHTGLRRLFDRNLIRLLPYDGINGIPEPEYALLDGVVTYYYVVHGG